MIKVKLRAAIESYRLRYGERLTYPQLSKLTGIAEQTLSSIGSREKYNPGLNTIEKLCRVLKVDLHDMLEMIDDPPKKKAKGKPKGKKKKKAKTKKS